MSLLEQASCIVHESRSQWSEERLLLPRLLWHAASHPDATPSFVELGALDGLAFSNTLALERCFNWSGVLIEANPINYAALQRSGRKSAKVHSAVCAGGATSTVVSAQGGATSGEVTTMPTSLRKKWQGETGANATATVRVPCRPLPAILQAAGWPRNQPITFLSLDVEGAESTVLSTVPQPISRSFAHALVEASDRGKASNGKVRSLLIREGGMLLDAAAAIKNSDVYYAAADVRVELRMPRTAPSGSAAAAGAGHVPRAADAPPSATASASSRAARHELGCVMEHALPAERMLLVSLLHAARGRPGHFLTVVGRGDGLESAVKSAGHAASSVGLALQRCYGWSGTVAVDVGMRDDAEWVRTLKKLRREREDDGGTRAGGTSGVGAVRVVELPACAAPPCSLARVLPQLLPPNTSRLRLLTVGASMAVRLFGSSVSDGSRFGGGSHGGSDPAGGEARGGALAAGIDAPAHDSSRQGHEQHERGPRRKISFASPHPLLRSVDVVLVEWRNRIRWSRCAGCRLYGATRLCRDLRLATPRAETLRVYTSSRLCKAVPTSRGVRSCLCGGNRGLNPALCNASETNDCPRYAR